MYGFHVVIAVAGTGGAWISIELRSREPTRVVMLFANAMGHIFYTDQAVLRCVTGLIVNHVISIVFNYPLCYCARRKFLVVVYYLT